MDLARPLVPAMDTAQQTTATDPMTFLVPVLLPFLVAAVVAGGSVIFWRKELARPKIFCLVSILLALGLSYLLQSVVDLVTHLWPLGAGYYVAVKPASEMIEAFERGRAIQSTVIAVVVVLVSLPLLSAVKRGLGR